MDLYAALFLDKRYVKEYQETIQESFPDFELIQDVHLSLCHMQLDGDMPDLFDCFVSSPVLDGVRWDLFEGRFSPYVYLVLVVKPNAWLKRLWKKFDKNFKIEVINGDYHVSLAKIKKEDYDKNPTLKKLNKMPEATSCTIMVQSMQIRERFCSEKLLEINLIR